MSYIMFVFEKFNRALEQALQRSFAIMDATLTNFGKISTQMRRLIGWQISTQGGIDIEAYLCFTTQVDCCGSLPRDLHRCGTSPR